MNTVQTLLVCVCVCKGRTVEQAVSLVNGEEEPFHFSVMQSSLLCNDQQSSLILQPMTGTVAPKDRLMTLTEYNFKKKIHSKMLHID